MGAHEPIGVGFDATGRRDVTEQGEEHMPLIVGLKNRPATGASVHDMIPRTFIGNPQLTGHGRDMGGGYTE